MLINGGVGSQWQVNDHEHWWVLVIVMGSSGMGVFCCCLSSMVVLVGVGVVVVVKERGNITRCNTSVTFALC